MQQQLQQVQTERASFIRQIEENHPGYKWRDSQGLVRVEEIEPEMQENETSMI